MKTPNKRVQFTNLHLYNFTEDWNYHQRFLGRENCGMNEFRNRKYSRFHSEIEVLALRDCNRDCNRQNEKILASADFTFEV